MDPKLPYILTSCRSYGFCARLLRIKVQTFIRHFLPTLLSHQVSPNYPDGHTDPLTVHFPKRPISPCETFRDGCITSFHMLRLTPNFEFSAFLTIGSL